MRSQMKIFLKGAANIGGALAALAVGGYALFYLTPESSTPLAKNPERLPTGFQSINGSALQKGRLLSSYMVDGNRVSEIELPRLGADFQKICVSVNEGAQVFCQRAMNSQGSVPQEEQQDEGSIRYKIGPSTLNEFQLQSLPSTACVITSGYSMPAMDCFPAPDRDGDKVGTFQGQSKSEMLRFRYFQPALNPDIRCIHTIGRNAGLNCF
ncbi:MAG: hypothetical protein MRY79_03295 [Alphaproteobacteria bacterium]|nr:hypothetical protein [Alphaproteobacteria bacterium]